MSVLVAVVKSVTQYGHLAQNPLVLVSIVSAGTIEFHTKYQEVLTISNFGAARIDGFRDETRTILFNTQGRPICIAPYRFA
jgi:hypothetical protein